MAAHKLASIPDSFRPVLWEEVTTGDIVYLQDLVEPTACTGPYRVQNEELNELFDVVKSRSFVHQDETLLYERGPLVVVELRNGAIQGVFSDVPLEVMEMTMPITSVHGGWVMQRARLFDQLTSDTREALDVTAPPGWRELYGTWAIIKSGQTGGIENLVVQLKITNSLAISGLMAELARLQHAFSVEFTEAAAVFSLQHATYMHLLQHLKRLLPEGGHVVR